MRRFGIRFVFNCCTYTQYHWYTHTHKCFVGKTQPIICMHSVCYSMRCASRRQTVVDTHIYTNVKLACVYMVCTSLCRYALARARAVAAASAAACSRARMFVVLVAFNLKIHTRRFPSICVCVCVYGTHTPS